MNEKQRKRWERFRKHGKVKFILFVGVLYWGILTALLFTLITTYYMETSPIRFDKEFFKSLITSLIVFPLGGVFVAGIMWTLNEKSYLKSSDDTIKKSE